jgi:hypothetical protein
MDLTIIQQGTFTSTGNNVFIELTSGVDWMKVYNITQAANNSQSAALAVEFYWQRGFAANSQYVYIKQSADTDINLIQYQTTGGFNFFDTSNQNPGALVSTITAISNATIPVVTNSGTNGLVAGSVVRLINVTGGTQVSGIEYTVGINTLSTTTFSLDFAPQMVAATTGSWRTIAYGPYYQPENYTIASISKAAQAVVIPTVAVQGLTVGQAVRINTNPAMGMMEINGLEGDIVAINTATNAITLNINSTAFSTYAWPLTGGAAFTPGVMVPFGMNTAVANANGASVTADATINTAALGMELTGGAGFPGGASADVLYWVAGKSFANSPFGE